MTPTVETFIAQAKAEVGYIECNDASCPDPEHETNRNHTKFAAEAGHRNGLPWCVTFLEAIAQRVGLVLPVWTADVDTLAREFRRDDRWSLTPHVGDFIFFAWDPSRPNDLNHVGVVIALNGDGSVDTIEGNTSTRNQRDGGYVMRRRRAKSSAIKGFGRPAYSASAPPVVETLIQNHGKGWELDAMQRSVPHYRSDKTDKDGRANFTIPVPIGRLPGNPISHSEVRPNVDGLYDPVPNSVTCTPDELNGGPATTIVIQGDEPLSTYHCWWHQLEDV